MNELITATLGGILITTLTFFVVLIIGHKNDVLPQSIISFFTQILLAIFFFFSIGLYEDAVLYSSIAVDIAEAWSELTVFEFEGFNKRNQLPLMFIGIFYVIFGPYPLLPILFNCFLIALLPAVIASACRKFGLGKSAKIAAWLVIFTPSITLNGPWLRKEAQAFFLIAILILAMSHIFKNQVIRGLLIGCIITYLFSIIRSQLIILSVVGLFLTVILNPNFTKVYMNFSKELRRRIFANLFIAILIISIPILFYIYSLQGFKNFAALNALIEFNSAPNQSTANLGANWRSNTNPIIFVFNLFRTLWGPPIWEWRNISMIIFGLEGVLVFILSFIAVISYYFHSKFRRVFFLLFITILPLWISSTVMLANYGLNSRIRAHYLIFIVPIAAAFYGELDKKLKNNKSLRN